MNLKLLILSEKKPDERVNTIVSLLYKIINIQTHLRRLKTEERMNYKCTQTLFGVMEMFFCLNCDCGFSSYTTLKTHSIVYFK